MLPGTSSRIPGFSAGLHVDLSRLVPVSLALTGTGTVHLLPPTGSSFGPLVWTRLCLCLRLPGSCRKLDWSSHVDPSRLVPVSLALPGTPTVCLWLLPETLLVPVSLALPGTRVARLLAPAGTSSGPLTWTRPDSCRLPPETCLVLSRGPVPTRVGSRRMSNRSRLGRPCTPPVDWSTGIVLATCRWLRLVLVRSSTRHEQFLLETRLVLSRGPVPIRAGVSSSSRYPYSASPARTMRLPAPAGNSSGPLNVDPSRLAPVSLAPPAPAGNSPGPLTWTRLDSCRCR